MHRDEKNGKGAFCTSHASLGFARFAMAGYMPLVDCCVNLQADIHVLSSRNYACLLLMS